MFDIMEATRPIWTGDTVYEESFMPVGERTVGMLYPMDEIIRVTDACRSVTFREGEDYLLRDGKLLIPEGSAIAVMPECEYHPMENIPELTSGRGFAHKDGGFLRFAEGGVFHQMQYVITYRHHGVWAGPAAPYDPAKLPRIRCLLREGEPFRLGYLGDSICAGANASARSNLPPYTPIWPDMVHRRLEQLSGCDIACSNCAMGGKQSCWGVENTTEFFRDFVPDLFVIAFGMNDGTRGVEPGIVRDNYRDMAEQIRAINPKCEFVFVSTMLPNPLAPLFSKTQADQEPLLRELADEYGDRAALAPMTAFHQHLLTKKHFYDMTGNNVNHPNDFLIRVYAQVVLSTIIGTL